MKSIFKISFTLALLAVVGLCVSCEEVETALTCNQCASTSPWSTGPGGACYTTQAACEDDTGKTCRLCD